MTSLPEPGRGTSPASQRLDRWLFFARIAKSRSIAAKMITSGHVRINSDKIVQPSRLVRPGDVLTVNAPGRLVVCRIHDCGTRRGPAPEARMLYEDMSPPPADRPRSRLDRLVAIREPGSGRPTKKERRAIDRLRPGRDSES